MKRLIFILIPLLVAAVSLSAQTIEISGTVVDSDGETVIGAESSIRIRGTRSISAGNRTLCSVQKY